MKTSLKYSDNGLILELLDKVGIKREIGILRQICHSPVVCGVNISLDFACYPCRRLCKTILQHMNVHELLHIKRLDFITNAISVLALCKPLV
jgi:beta-lactamase regulating signal transducer with metallopeptidase domain